MLQYQDELAQARDELSKSEVNLNTQLRNVTGLQEKVNQDNNNNGALMLYLF